MLGVIAEVPEIDLRIRIARLGGFEFAELGQLRLHLWLQSIAQLFLELDGCLAILRHLHFQLEVSPVRVTELRRDLMAQRENFFHERSILGFGEAVLFCDDALAYSFALHMLHHSEILPGHIDCDAEFVIAGFDAGRGEQAFGCAIKFRLGEGDGFFCLGDVAVEVCGGGGKFLAQLLHFIALRLG